MMSSRRRERWTRERHYLRRRQRWASALLRAGRKEEFNRIAGSWPTKLCRLHRRRFDRIVCRRALQILTREVGLLMAGGELS